MSPLPQPLLSRIRQSELADIYAKVEAGERLGFEDGVRLYRTQDIHALGATANLVRERKNGNRAYFVRNQHINHTNICIYSCTFCAFGKKRGQNGAYEMALEEVFAQVRSVLDEPLTEIHIVGGVHPDFPYDYYLEMLRGIKRIRPDVHLKAFTAVEIDFLSKMSHCDLDETIGDLKRAGIDSVPGGGAEIFAEPVRKEICPGKASADCWLDIHRRLHVSGIPSNATMLYGHIETVEDRVDHLIRLRELQDETGGFLTFIPLAFHPENTEMNHLPGPTPLENLKAVAVARLLLDNFPHIKAYWIMIGPEMAQLALNFGADDIDGTIIEEKIVHDAGAKTARGLTYEELIQLVQEAGREPVERDALYGRIVEERISA